MPYLATTSKFFLHEITLVHKVEDPAGLNDLRQAVGDQDVIFDGGPLDDSRATIPMGTVEIAVYDGGEKHRYRKRDWQPYDKHNLVVLDFVKSVDDEVQEQLAEQKRQTEVLKKILGAEPSTATS